MRRGFGTIFFSSIYLLLLCLYSLSSSCGRKGKLVSEGNFFEGLVIKEGKGEADVDVFNLTNFEQAKSDYQGKFRIKLNSQNDKLLLLKDGYGTITNPQKVIELKPLIRKTFYFKNFEKYMLDGNVILALLQDTKFLSPVLSNGQVILYYPEGTSEIFFVSQNWFFTMNPNAVEDYSVLDIDQYEKVNFPDYITVVSDDPMEFVKIPEGKTFFSKGITQIPSGIYTLKFGEKTRRNVFLYGNTNIISGGFIFPEKTKIISRGKAFDLSYASGVLIWIEGEDEITFSKPEFSVGIPEGSKRIVFSKFGFFPYVVDVENPESVRNIEITLDYSSYVTGKVIGQQNYFVQVPSEKGILEIKYSFKGSDFLIQLPAMRRFQLVLTAENAIPKLINIFTSQYFSDLGEIYLCSKDDENCIIGEGMSFLKYNLFDFARQVFSFSNSVSGKIGLAIADMNILFSLPIFEREKSSEIIFELQKIFDVVKLSGDVKLCGEIPLNIPLLFFFSLPRATGCVGENSFEFLKSIFKIAEAFKIYISSHHYSEKLSNVVFAFDIEYLRNLGEVFYNDEKILTFESWFDPATSISDIKQGIEILSVSVQQSKSCSETDEIFCKKDEHIVLKIKGGFSFPILSQNANLDALKKSLEDENYYADLTEIVSLLPFDIKLPQSIDMNFIKINLKRLLQNNLRKFLPKVVFYEGRPVLAIEVEVPIGFRGVKENSFLPPMFAVGDMPHFRYSGFPELEKDGVFPESTTDNFEDWTRQERIFYFLFDDPTFNSAVLLSPCKVAISDELRQRWCGKTDGFSLPTNQMLSDVFAVAQKLLRLYSFFPPTSVLPSF
ncbi:hypothetical protein HRbin19_01008 [bacterium HR19]|nr:hypothetical protein HRbin19_01008 [bacterium HR19]